MTRRAAMAVALLLWLGSATARAQVPGDTVRIDTAKGPVEGTLVDRLPTGYLVNKGKTSVVVPYTTVTGIAKLAPSPLAPMVVPAGAAASPKTAPRAPVDSGWSGLAVDPAPAGEVPAGAEPPPPPPVPTPELVTAPPISPVMMPVAALPAPPKPLPPQKYERRSKLLMGTGIAMVGLGVLASLTGAALYLNGASQSEQSCDYYPSGERCYENTDRAKLMDAGRITLLAGIAVGVIGIPMWSVGAREVPVKEPRAQVSVGPGSAAVAVRF